MEPNDTRSATVEARASERAFEDARARFTLVFRFAHGRELVDLDRARALTVGRGSACDVCIADPSLSRQHARFVRDGDELRVEDLGSRNGISLGGKSIKSATLQSGDVLMLGNVAVSVHAFGMQRSITPPSSDAASELNWAGARMQDVRKTVEKIAPTPLPVLVLGETGSGKELIAREIHRLSPRAQAPLRVVNCAAIPATLIESTLFGHERGAFTGADRVQSGVFEQAHHGTIFLDEIGELSAAAQAALLRVLETGRYSRVGATREQEADARVVAATHRDLYGMTATGAFRLDLLHRLDAVSVRLPALRERPDALEPLIAQFLLRAQKVLGARPKQIDQDALAVLRAYDWPGNVRELRNVIERAVAIADGDRIGVSDLPERVRAGSSRSVAPVAVAPAEPAGSAITGASLKDKHAHEERELLARTLEATGGDQTEAAVRLGWSLRTLQRRVRQYGLTRVVRVARVTRVTRGRP